MFKTSRRCVYFDIFTEYYDVMFRGICSNIGPQKEIKTEIVITLQNALQVTLLCTNKHMVGIFGIPLYMCKIFTEVELSNSRRTLSTACGISHIISAKLL